MQLREAIASPRTLILSFNFPIARVVKHTLDDFSNILLGLVLMLVRRIGICVMGLEADVTYQSV
jgi:hypothetical protein